MKTASLIAALAAALALTAAPAVPAPAQTETVQTSTEPAARPSRAPSSVSKSQPAPVSQAAPQVAANATDVNRGARGTGVATGFVAAGVGLAILGLFVRKRGRHDDGETGGSGTYTRM